MNAPTKLTEVATAAQTATLAPASEFDRLLQQPAKFTPQDLLVEENLDRLERIAARMSSGRMTVPEYLQGNAGDCLAICIQAMLWNMDPFAIAQKTHIVKGKLGYEAQLINAVLQNSGAIRGLPRYEYRGEGAHLECRAGAVPRGETEVLWNEWLSMASIETKNSSLWKTNPRQQLGYLQIKNWARAYAPGAILGVYTVDELEDMPARGASSSPASATPAPAEAPEPAAPTWPADAFAKQFPRWSKAIADSLKTVDEILAIARSKGALTAEQEAQIKAQKPATQSNQGEPDADFVAAMDAAEGAEQ